MVDDCFKVEKSKWGTWSSVNDDDKKIVTSLTEQGCIEATRFYLKGLQEGFTQSDSKYDGTVGGKL